MLKFQKRGLILYLDSPLQTSLKRSGIYKSVRRILNVGYRGMLAISK